MQQHYLGFYNESLQPRWAAAGGPESSGSIVSARWIVGAPSVSVGPRSAPVATDFSGAGAALRTAPGPAGAVLRTAPGPAGAALQTAPGPAGAALRTAPGPAGADRSWPGRCDAADRSWPGRCGAAAKQDGVGWGASYRGDARCRDSRRPFTLRAVALKLEKMRT